MSGGGDGVFHPTEEVRRKIGERSRITNTGRKHTEEYKQKMSKMMTENNPNKGGKCLTPQKIAQFTEYAKRPKTEAQKKKMSNSAKKRKIICVETGEVFNSMKEAAEKKNAYYTAITCAVYDSKRKAAGYHWKTYEGL